MSNNPTDERPRKRSPRQGASSEQQAPRQSRQRGGQQEGARQSRQRGERQGQRRGRGEHQDAQRARQGGEPQRQFQPGVERQRPQRAGRMSREEVEWARDLWTHREPPDEIAQQLGVEVSEIEALIATWEAR